MDPDLFQPEAAAKAVIQNVTDDASERPGEEVEKAKDGGVVASVGLAELGEVFEVVGAQDGVDGYPVSAWVSLRIKLKS